MASLHGLEFPDLPDGYMATDAVLLMKVINGDGQVQLVEHRTTDLSSWEAIGMTTTYCDGLRKMLITPDDDGDGDA